MKCTCCGSVEAVRVFALTVDGSPLRLTLALCGMHGEAFLLRAGKLVGEFLIEGGFLS